MEPLVLRTKRRITPLRHAVMDIVKEIGRGGCSVNEIMAELKGDEGVEQTFNRPIIELVVNELEADGSLERKDRFIRWNHGRSLCGKTDSSRNISRAEAERNPPPCLCCGNPMKVMPPESTSMEQLGVFALTCDYCSS